MSGRESEEAYYAYLDGKHQAMYLIETQNQKYDIKVYSRGCYKWGYAKYFDEFIRGVNETYEKESEMRRPDYKRAFPQTVRPRGICHSTDKVDVQEIWSKMYQ